MGSAAPSLSPILRAGSSTPLPARSLCSSARRNPRCLCSGSCPLRRRLRWQRRRRRRSSAAGSHGTDTNCRFQCNSTSPAIYIFDEMRDPKVCLPSGRPLPLLFDFLAAATSSPPLHHNVISSSKTVKMLPKIPSDLLILWLEDKIIMAVSHSLKPLAGYSLRFIAATSSHLETVLDENLESTTATQDGKDSPTCRIATAQTQQVQLKTGALEGAPFPLM